MSFKRNKITFQNLNDLLGAPEEGGTTDIEISKIRKFENHPFKVLENESMDELIESIKTNGVLNPVLVRPIDDTNYSYEMLSGHRRLYAATSLGLLTIPAIVKEMDDDTATIAMIDSNIQREELLPSERAWALRMKLEAVKRQGKRNDLTSGNDCQKLTTEEIGEGFGLKGRQVRNYIRLTYLIPQLLEYVDKKAVPFVVGVELSFFFEDDQNVIYEYLSAGNKITTRQIKVLRKYTEDGKKLTGEDIGALLNESKSKKREFKLEEKTIKKYFPENYSSQQIQEVVMRLIEEWSLDNK